MKTNKTKHIILYNRDQNALSKIKDDYGLDTDSQAVRFALRNFRGLAHEN